MLMRVIKFSFAAETILLEFQNYLVLGTSVMIPTLLVSWMGGSDVIELVQYKERLQCSNQYLIAKIEAAILQL